MSEKKQDLLEKTYVVTGANSGIGYEAAHNFASRGAILGLVCRNEARGHQALAAIHGETRNDKISLYLADFNSLADVLRMSGELLADFPKIDVLCNNAGGSNASRVLTSEGFEATFVTNHLSGFLLTTRLMPALIKAGETHRARIVFTSSLGHTNSAIDFDDLNLAQGYSTLKAYGRSKLMNLLTARELQRRYGDKNIVASSFHPGMVRTAIWSKGGILAKLVGIVMYPFMVNIEKGSDTFIWLASSDDEACVCADGNYFFERRRGKPAGFATDEAAKKLWLVSEELIGQTL